MLRSERDREIEKKTKETCLMDKKNGDTHAKSEISSITRPKPVKKTHKYMHTHTQMIARRTRAACILSISNFWFSRKCAMCVCVCVYALKSSLSQRPIFHSLDAKCGTWRTMKLFMHCHLPPTPLSFCNGHHFFQFQSNYVSFTLKLWEQNKITKVYKKKTHNRTNK